MTEMTVAVRQNVIKHRRVDSIVYEVLLLLIAIVTAAIYPVPIRFQAPCQALFIQQLVSHHPTESSAEEPDTQMSCMTCKESN